MEDPSANREEKPSPTRRKWTLGALTAIVIGVAAALGSAGIYGTVGSSGNGVDAAATTSAGRCVANGPVAAAIEPHLTGDIAAMALRSDPENLSQLSFNDGDGETITLADTGARLRLINLWATWCAPCREEMPWLDTLQAERGGDDFAVVAISVDGGSDAKPRAFLDEIGVSRLAFYHDPTIEVFNAMRRQGLALGLPVTLLVDDNGCVIANMNGPAHWSSPDAFEMIDAAIAANRSR
ncbi:MULTISPECIES: TlpA disulfide reductase family protein [unclassified Roseitalea]|uniref:thiol:disulfide interchange protein TlpA n=1 Tax=unclassified Roseitalea TaxID=2639107 RepID=UPI00273DB315|nr:MULTISPECIES: TlpA disulfide reductase family protein [unclassified Roseitalea]